MFTLQRRKNRTPHSMTLIDLEKLAMFREHYGHILAKPCEHRTEAENQWLQWAEKRLLELEAAK